MMRRIRLNRVLAVVLAIALVIPSVTVPMAVSGASSNWTVSNGTATAETSEAYIVDTAVVEFTSSGAGYIQHTEQMKELIGTDGEDGKGFVHVLFEDGSASLTNARSYAFLQFIGSAQTTGDIPRDGVTTQGITWYLAGHSTTDGRIDNHAGTVAMAYGPYSKFSAAGYRMAFSQLEDGRVYVRATGNGVYNAATNYTTAEAGQVASVQTLDSIIGDGGETGEDGVYLRLRANTGLTTKCTISVAYPRPADFDYSKSHWKTNSSATIVSQTTETWFLDTISADITGPNGFVQHNIKHTELIGKNGLDGKGWVNVIAGDGTKEYYKANGYNFLQLIGDPTLPALNRTADTANTKGITWYLRTNNANGAGIYRGDNRSADFKIYTSNVDNLKKNGQTFLFTENSAGKVQIRGNSVGTDSTYNDYDDTVSHASTKMLSEIQGENGGTAADGVYVRVETERDTATHAVTVSVFYPADDIVQIQPELSDSITLHYTAVMAVPQSTAPVMKFAKADTDDVITVTGVKGANDNEWTFAYKDILPQDIYKNVVGTLYTVDGETETAVANSTYSVAAYLTKMLINNTAYAEDTALQTLLLQLLEYGTEAQRYFDAAETDLASDVFYANVAKRLDASGASTLTTKYQGLIADADMGQATPVETLVAGIAEEGYQWQSATLSLQDYVKIRFRFTAPVDADFAVKIGEQIYTLANSGIISVGGSYYVYSEGIKVSDFDKTFTATFYTKDNPVGQTVTYSVNTYMNWMSGQAVSEVYDMAQCLYNYGVAAAAYVSAGA